MGQRDKCVLLQTYPIIILHTKHNIVKFSRTTSLSSPTIRNEYEKILAIKNFY